MSTNNYIVNVVKIPPYRNGGRDDEFNRKRVFFAAAFHVTCMVAQIIILLACYWFAKWLTRREQRMQQLVPTNSDVPRAVKEPPRPSSSSDTSTENYDTGSSGVHSNLSSDSSEHGSQDSVLESVHSAKAPGKKETNRNSAKAETIRSPVDSTRRYNPNQITYIPPVNSLWSISAPIPGLHPLFGAPENLRTRHQSVSAGQSLQTSHHAGLTISSDVETSNNLRQRSDRSDKLPKCFYTDTKYRHIGSRELMNHHPGYLVLTKFGDFKSGGHQTNDNVCHSSIWGSDSLDQRTRLHEILDQSDASGSEGVTPNSESKVIVEDDDTVNPSKTDVHFDAEDD